jgi:hypothetical protein
MVKSFTAFASDPNRLPPEGATPQYRCGWVAAGMALAPNGSRVGAPGWRRSKTGGLPGLDARHNPAGFLAFGLPASDGDA